MSKAWILAQFIHYGLNVNEKVTIPQLRTELGAAIKAGKCKVVPNDIAKLAKSLQERYDVLKKAHAEAEQRQREEEFPKLSSPSAEACYSIELFLRKYFLDRNGKVDRNKTTKPISLPGFTDRASLHQVAENIAGLTTHSGGKEPHRILVIGWNGSGVFQMAAKIGSEQKKNHLSLKVQQWERKLQTHNEFVRKNSKSSRNAHSASDAIGHYFVRSTDFEEGWDETESMVLNIHQLRPGALQASFDFGVLEGTMLLSPDEDALGRIVAEMKREEEKDEEEYDSMDESDGLEDEDEDEDGGASQSKIRYGAKLNDLRPTKKLRVAPEHPLKLHLRWRGRETGEGEIDSDSYGDNRGFLKFADKTCTRFEGVANFSSVGFPEDWSTFSESAYESAKVGRWH